MQWLNKKQVVILMVVSLLSLLMWVWGYHRWVQPLHGIRPVRLRPVTFKKEVFVFDEQAELQRWSSANGGLLSWQRKEQQIQFRWLGSYAAMLQILQNWPQALVIKHLQWQRGKRGGVQWSGTYALVN